MSLCICNGAGTCVGCGIERKVRDEFGTDGLAYLRSKLALPTEERAPAMLLAQRALRGWTDLYAKLQNESGDRVSRVLDYNLPPADHVKALEVIAEALATPAWTDGDFLDQALTGATGSILSPYAAGLIRERAKDLRKKAALVSPRGTLVDGDLAEQRRLMDNKP